MFDLGTTHSFISTEYVLQLDFEHAKIETNYRLKLPNNSVADCPILHKHVSISIVESTFIENLI